MEHFVTSQCGVIRLQIQLEVVHQVIGPQEVQARRCVRVILVLGRLLRFRLNIKLACKANRFLVIHCHMQKPGQVIQLAFHIRVEHGLVVFTASPERIAFTTKIMRHFHGLFDLRSRHRKHFHIWACRCSLIVSRVREQIRGAPQTLSICDRVCAVFPWPDRCSCTKWVTKWI